MTKQKFIESIGQAAHNDMIKSKILASVTIAQAILESAWGKSGLATKGNNLFGIKGTYNGKSVTMLTSECYNGKWCKIKAPFRKYPSIKESISDHSAMLERMKRYSNIVGNNDYEEVCHYLQKDGYATDPNYPSKLINIIDSYNLVRFDTMNEYVGSSIVEYLNYHKMDSSLSGRKKLAKKHGIKLYAGTKAQNTKLLTILRGF
jgi:flagellum-specific peptidoglycan hydrolase FlgJ